MAPSNYGYGQPVYYNYDPQNMVPQAPQNYGYQPAFVPPATGAYPVPNAEPSAYPAYQPYAPYAPAQPQPQVLPSYDYGKTL